MKQSKLAVLIIVTCFTSCNVFADGNTSGSISVTATIPASCEVFATPDADTPLTSSYGSMVFDMSKNDWRSGSAISAPLALTVSCTKGNTPKVTLDKGTSWSITNSEWNMKNTNGDSLAYKVFTDSSMDSPVTPDNDFNTTGANPFSFDLYGKLDAITSGETLAAGDYSDTINMTVDWS